MSDILTALRDDIAAAIRTLDVGRVVTDPRNLTPPCVRVSLPTVTRINTLEVDKLDVDVVVQLIAPQGADAWTWLGPRIVPVLAAFKALTAEPTFVEIAEGVTAAAYELSINRTLKITEEDGS